MSDVLLLLNLIRDLTGQIRGASELIRKMREEGRDTLTADELATLQRNDDDARGDLVDAIARAKAEGR